MSSTAFKSYHERGWQAVSTVSLPKQHSGSAHPNFRFKLSSFGLAADVLLLVCDAIK